MELSNDNIMRFNNLYESASKRFSPYVLIDNQIFGYVGLFVKLKIKKSIKELKQCLEIIPNHIDTLFLIGKCFQSLGGEKSSLHFFNQALSIEFSSLEYDEDFSKYERYN
jgi:tetratricopeptide (TPR) repeat protein